MSKQMRQETVAIKSIAASIALACIAIGAAGTSMAAQPGGAGTAPALGAPQEPPADAAQQDAQTRQASSGSSESGKKKPVTLQTVVVTGSIVPRSASDSASPIDVITAGDLARTGQVNLATALRALLPSLNMPQAAVRGSATGNIRPAQLRGLSPDATLVLINGKPFHTTAYTNTSGFSSGSSPTDLNSIPMAAVSRIEVLRDGASTLYGSSAVAGVVNIILKSGATGGSVSATDGFWDGYQGHTGQVAASGGIALGQNGWVRLSADYLRRTPTNQAGPDNRYPSDPTYGKVTMQFGLPYTLSKQLGLNAQYTLGGNATLYAFSLFSKREGQQPGTFRSLSQYKTTFPDVVPLVPEGYLPVTYNGMLDNNTTIGIRGLALGWNYDVSATTGTSHVKANQANTVNPSMGTASPRTFFTGTTIFREDDLNVDFRREFDAGFAQPLNVAWGLQYQRQSYIAKAGDPGSYFGAGVGGISEASAGKFSRNDKAVYLAADSNITSKLSAQASARYEYYSDFGNNFSWGLKGRYEFTPSLAVRASYTTGFRAPSVQQEGYSSIGTTFVHVGPDLIPFQIGTFQPTSPPAAALGARPLKPETSEGITAGVVWTPEGGPQVTLDIYQIRVLNTIAWTGNLVGPKVQAFLESQGVQFVNGVRFFTNNRNNTVRGADLVASWPFTLADSSKLNLTFALSNYEARITSLTPFPPVWATIGLNPAFGRADLASQPVTKGILGANWSKGRWNLNGMLTRYSSLWAIGTTPATDEYFAARYLTDVSARYALNDEWAVTVGSNNVFNVYPPRANLPGYSLSGNIPYLNDMPFGYFGRYVFATIDFGWK